MLFVDDWKGFQSLTYLITSSIRIIDISGKTESRRSKIASGVNKHVLPTQGLAKGIYFVTLSNQDNLTIARLKLILK